MEHGTRIALACAAAVLAGCATPHAAATPPTTPLAGAARLEAPLHGRRAGTSPIQHVVIIVQENRSFNYMFHGYPGATTADYGYNSSGQKIKLKPVSLAETYEIDHTSPDYFLACDGSGSIPGTNCKMDGFDKEYVDGKAPANPQYAYAPKRDVKPYWSMAKQYVLGDHMFTSQIDASFVSHQYIIAGQANSEVDLPTGLWGCGAGGSDTVTTLTASRTIGPSQSPCQDYQTLGDEAVNAGLTWRFYSVPSNGTAYVWNGYQAVNHVYNGPQWNNIVTPPSQFLTDVQNGTLANVTWVEPTWADSDHSGSGSKTGPAWVASVVNAVGESKFWDSTAIFVMWDEWGGWYDPVAPPYEDYDGLGFRVPLLVISPYAKQGYVSHTQFEHGSILRFVEDTFGLPQLAASDTRANDPAADCMNYSQPARAFTPITGSRPRTFFMSEPQPNHPLDEE